MTAGLAYNAAPDSPWGWLGEGEGAIERVAVTWAVLRFSATGPASIEDQAAIAEAIRSTLALAATLGLNEDDLRDVLRQCRSTLATTPGGRDPCGIDWSA